MSPDAAPLALLGLVVKASLVLALAAGAAASLRRSSSALRYAVWVLGLGGAMALPLLEAVGPVLPVPVVTAPGARPAPATGPPAAGHPAPIGAPEARSGPGPAMTGTGRPGAWLVAVWAVGALVTFSRSLVGTLRLSRWSRGTALVTDPSWLALTRRLSRQMGIRRSVALRCGQGPAIPVTWGVLRPTIWIPGGASTWTEERRAAVLAHELAHVRRFDALTQWVVHVALAVHWYHPLAHVAARRARDERERACDDAVLALGTPPAAYARHLLDVARAFGEGPRLTLAFGPPRRRTLEGRLRSILDERVARGRPHRAHAALAAVIALGVVLPLAALRPVTAGPVRAERTGSAPRPSPATALRRPAPEPTAEAAPPAPRAAPPAARALSGGPQGTPPGPDTLAEVRAAAEEPGRERLEGALDSLEQSLGRLTRSREALAGRLGEIDDGTAAHAALEDALARLEQPLRGLAQARAALGERLGSVERPSPPSPSGPSLRKPPG